MSVTIVWPIDGGRFGPGFEIELSTDVIGPLPANNFWHVAITDPSDDSQIQYEEVRPTLLHTVRWTFLTTPFTAPLQPQRPFVLDGGSARIIAERFEGSTLVESLSKVITWDMVTGIPFYEQHWLLDQLATTGGLTTEQAAQLEETHTATIRTMGPAGVSLPVPVVETLIHPPYGLMQVEPSGIVASGDGFLTGDTDPFPSYYGLWWEFTVVPPELGFLDGPTRRYAVRMLQLQVVHTISGVDVVTQVEDADYERVVWTWGQVLPTRINYSILPGVEVTFHRVIWFA